MASPFSSPTRQPRALPAVSLHTHRVLSQPVPCLALVLKKQSSRCCTSPGELSLTNKKTNAIEMLRRLRLATGPYHGRDRYTSLLLTGGAPDICHHSISRPPALPSNNAAGGATEWWGSEEPGPSADTSRPLATALAVLCTSLQQPRAAARNQHTLDAAHSGNCKEY
jgi:hypothetical protein